ncbi:MAG TPA: tetratricopeptide repeat protein [Terracidiphilus sp.]|nr:tetratricopeptide repeat protein [Terracidiphilus sp.]
MKRLLPLLCVLILWAPLLHADPQALRIVSPHFTLITDAGDRQGRDILDNFEHMRWMFQTLFPTLQIDPTEPMVIVALRNRKEFQTIEPAEYLGKGQLNLAGYFLNASDKHYILLRLDTEGPHPYATVLHEYTHLQFRFAGSWMPLWLNEGLAEFYQNTEFKQKQVLLGEPSVDDILFLRQNSLIPLATLFRVDHNSPYYHQEDKGSIFYAESWALTHYLEITDRQKGTQRVHDYSVRMSHHEDPVAAAQGAFGDLKALQQQLEAYIRAQQYMQFVMNAAAAPIDSSTYRVTPISKAEFDAQRADVLAHVGRTQEALALLNSLAASNPTPPVVYEGLAYLALSDGSQPDALKYYQRAIELGSTNFFTWFNAASMLQSTGADDTAITADLKRATELNPTFAPAFDELAQLYARREDKLDDALAMSQKAAQLEPNNMYFRLHVADIQLRRNQLDAAEATYRLARTLASTSSEARMLDSRLEDLARMRTNLRVTSSAHDDSQPQSDQPQVLTADAKPRHPASPPTGPRHTVEGVMDKAECTYPAVLDLEVMPKASSAVLHLYAGDFTKIQLTSDSAQTAEALNPCADFNGRAARIVYAESADKSADGQLVSIELRR